MSLQGIRYLRSIFAFLVIVTAASFGLSTWPGGLGAQGWEPPCEFDDGSDEWACVEMSHIWAGQCEGHDCYSSMEFCCYDPW